MAEWLMALVLKTSRLTSRRFESCPFRHGSRSRFFTDSFFESNPVPSATFLSEKNKPGGLYFLATVFKSWVLALVAVFVIIIPILFCNRF